MSIAQSIEIKNEILERIVEAFFSEDFENNARLIPYDMRPKGSDVPYRCCIYKERAILKERVKAGLGFALEEDDETKLLSTFAKEAIERKEPDTDPLTVLDAACVGCVPSRIYVTDLCQGCVARPCQTACKFGAISMVDGKSKIDGSKCKNCKMCMRACPYNAIVKLAVPCEDACPVGAIHKDENNITRIDFDRCITCGKCVAACPFGAVNEKSQLVDIMKNIKAPDKKLVAMIAPSIAGQFGCSIYKLKSAIKKAGFDEVIEVAQGADITTINEAKEFEERMEEGAPFMTTSCCAGYNNLTATGLPEIQEFKSTTGTPLFYTAQIVREQYPDAISVFVSPCVAKRKEGMNNENVDYVMNYQELNALIKGIDPYTKEEFDENHILKNPEVNKVLRMLAGKEIEFSNEDLDKDQLELYNALKVWRSEKYNTLHLKPYQIFTNQELIRIITHDIKKEEDLLNIKGITREKYEKFGKELFSILSNI